MFDDFYGLTGRPFQLTPDPTFYFESLTHRKALSYLGYGLAQSEGFIVITGEVGAGKSTLVAHLMATIDPVRLTAAQIVTSKLDGEEIVHVVAQAFGLAVEGHDKASALGLIEHFLHEEARAGRRCLLIVDEAQNLSVAALEELRMLSNFQLGAHPLLQTLLLGQPEFREILAQRPELEQLRQRVIASHHLQAMEPDEIRPYIEHRLKCVGWDGNPAFDQDVFAGICKASGALPRRINQIVNRLLMLGAVEQSDRLGSAMLQQVLLELNGEGTISPLRAAPGSSDSAGGEPAYVDPLPAGASPTATGIDLAQVEDLLAERDAQIAELQQALLELADRTGGVGAAQSSEDGDERFAELAERLSALESRQIEQDRTIRHTLTMLIEWIEGDDFQRAA